MYILCRLPIQPAPAPAHNTGGVSASCRNGKSSWGEGASFASLAKHAIISTPQSAPGGSPDPPEML